MTTLRAKPPHGLSHQRETNEPRNFARRLHTAQTVQSLCSVEAACEVGHEPIGGSAATMFHMDRTPSPSMR
jgi:hypothetical protein